MKLIQYAFAIGLILYSVNSFSEVKNLSSEQLIQAQIEGAIIIDIRTPEEWEELGTVPNAHKIMFFNQNRQPLVDEFLIEFNKIVNSKDRAIVLVCKSGNRSGVVSKYLNEKLGYSNVSHLEKGMVDWISKKHKVEKNNNN
jgi:rhodanese-related sulfurtransferase